MTTKKIPLRRTPASANRGDILLAFMADCLSESEPGSVRFDLGHALHSEEAPPRYEVLRTGTIKVSGERTAAEAIRNGDRLGGFAVRFDTAVKHDVKTRTGRSVYTVFASHDKSGPQALYRFVAEESV